MPPGATSRWELHEVEPRLHQPRVADEDVDALLDPLRHPVLAAFGRDGVGLHHRGPEAHRPDQAVSTLTEDHVLDGLEVLPGFSCVVSTVFRAYSARIPRGPPRWSSAALKRPPGIARRDS